MKSHNFVIALGAASILLPVHAAELNIPNSFSAGQPAVAAEVNANFTAVETAVDDNHANIEALQTQVQSLQSENASLQETVSTLQTEVEALQSAQVSTIAKVESPRTLETNYVDYQLQDEKGIFTIEFNVAMDVSSAKVDSNVTVVGSGGNATGTITWLHGNSTLRYTMNEEFITISPCFSGGLDLTIKGEGESPVRDMQGKPLDGDKNGLPGGDFVVNFDIVC